jgi:archaemetzincin
MPELQIICVQFAHDNLLDPLLTRLREGAGFTINRQQADPPLQDCYDENRQQYDALKILKKTDLPPGSGKTILYTSLDLYIPILTFVFGLAGLGGPAAIVSSHRLTSEYYGLPADEPALLARLYKETIHEYGHLLNLRHCSNYRCVMASSSTVDDLDVKGDTFCGSCLTLITEYST